MFTEMKMLTKSCKLFIQRCEHTKCSKMCYSEVQIPFFPRSQNAMPPTEPVKRMVRIGVVSDLDSLLKLL